MNLLGNKAIQIAIIYISKLFIFLDHKKNVFFEK